MLRKYHWIVLYIVHFTAFCLGGRFFPDTVYIHTHRSLLVSQAAPVGLMARR